MRGNVLGSMVQFRGFVMDLVTVCRTQCFYVPLDAVLRLDFTDRGGTPALLPQRGLLVRSQSNRVTLARKMTELKSTTENDKEKSFEFPDNEIITAGAKTLPLRGSIVL